MRMRTRLIVLAATLFVTALMSVTVHAADITVNSNCSLANAITAANSDVATGGCPAGVGADTITLAENVTLEASLPTIESDITIEGNDYTISGNEEYQIFWVEETGALTIQNATLADGRGVDDDDMFDQDLLLGGAIANWGMLEVRDSIFTGNSADRGGAIGNWGQAIAIVNCVFNCDSGPCSGATIYSIGDANILIESSDFRDNNRGALLSIGAAVVEIIDSTFTGSSISAIAVEGAEKLRIVDSVVANNNTQDGAVKVDSTTIEIGNSEFRDNVATYSGAIRIWDREKDAPPISIVDSIFVNNSTRLSDGGALFMRGEAIINNNTFIGNSTNYENSDGGAISFWGNVSISNSTFINNSAVRNGGAIHTRLGEATITGSKFENNSASQSGGAIHTAYDAETVLRASDFTGNSALEDGGAVLVYGQSSIRIYDSRFRANSAGDEGGAVRGKEESIITVDQSTFLDNTAEDGGAIYSWGETNVNRSTFTNNSAIEEGGAIANHGMASINSSILADNPGGDCHIGRKGELLQSGNNHIADGSCGATWSGTVTESYCPPGQELDGVCQIGAPASP